jgi:hypothetical protein
MAEGIEQSIDQFGIVAGGETAGIRSPRGSRSASSSDDLRAKEAQGSRAVAQIEGSLEPGRRVLPIEDSTGDAKSKLTFVRALRRGSRLMPPAPAWPAFERALTGRDAVPLNTGVPDRRRSAASARRGSG